jgi:phage-related baseplate assembly protein
MADLTEVTFAEKDSSTIETEVLDQYEETAGSSLADADPRKLMLQALVPILVSQRGYIDTAAKQNLLYYATGDYLDQIGYLVNCTRNAASAASCTVRFTLSAARTVDTVIASGKRVTSGDGVYFATTAEATITAGSTYVDVTAECTTTGTGGNDYAIGTLTTLVDSVTYVASVTNITASASGTDEETDDSFRERIHEASESFSVAGPTGAYEYWAKSASSTITDVAVYSPSAGVVTICPLLTDGEIPSDELLASVLEICSDEDVRPLTDNVKVVAPTQVSYDIDVEYYISEDDATTAASIQTAVETAVETYETWQKSVLGRCIDPSRLIYLMIKAGASRVAVTLPVYTVLEQNQVAKESTVSANYGGTE